MGDQDSKSFWLTLPGIITGGAAFVTAVGGLLFTFYQIGWIGKKVEPKPTETIQTTSNRTDRIFVVGEVNDEAGKPLIGANVRAINTETNQQIGETGTDNDGRFEMKVEFNRYKDRIKLITEKGGYKKYTIILGTEQVTYPAVLIKANN